MFKKMRKVKNMRYRDLTLGEKILKAVMFLVKVALVVAIGAAVLGVVLAFVVAFGIMSAFAGGFYNAGQAYTGDYYYRRGRNLR